MFELCAGKHKAFYFHSFLIDMFFSLSFCITWGRKQSSLNMQVKSIKNED